jgi:hypothetical protein
MTRTRTGRSRRRSRTPYVHFVTGCAFTTRSVATSGVTCPHYCCAYGRSTAAAVIWIRGTFTGSTQITLPGRALQAGERQYCAEDPQLHHVWL